MMYVINKEIEYQIKKVIYDSYTYQGVTVVFFVFKNRVRGPPLLV